MRTFQSELANWFNSSPSRTPASLSRKTGVSESTIRRLLQNEAKANLETMFNILRVVADVKNINEILEIEFPEISKVMKNIIDNARDGNNILPQEYESLVQTYEGSVILWLAGNRKNTSPDEIILLLGTNGERMLSKLIDIKTIYLENGFLRTSITTVLNAETLKAISMNLIKHFNCDNIGKIPTALISESDSVNMNSARKINDILWKAHKEISDILKDPKNNGDYPIYYIQVLNVLKGNYS